MVEPALPDALLDWLLDSDPALRWQVERDLAGAPPTVWRATRARVATEGFGARLLAHQDPDGQWAGGAYFPRSVVEADGADTDGADGDGADGDGAEEQAGERAGSSGEPGQPWTATTWSLNALHEWGLDAAALGDTADRLAANSRWEYDDLPYWGGEVDCCINAFTLANGVWLGADVTGIARWFLEHQQPDGGWNCEWVDGSTRSSVHSTLNTVEGLLSYEQTSPRAEFVEALAAARRKGEEYLLERHLRRRRSTGELLGPWTSWFAYPFRWICSPLHALDHFRAAAQHDRVPPDPRLGEAIDVLRAARQPDGTWLQEDPLTGAVWFEVDVPAGQPSKWLTLHGTRVLAWWDGADGTSSAAEGVGTAPPTA